MDVLYAINAKTEPAGSLSPEITGVPATLTGSSISIANLLTYVNRYFPDVLPESVLRHFGHSERPAGKLGEGATAVSGAELCERQFQSTPPAWGATQKSRPARPETAISIHAPREGGDQLERGATATAYISIHAPREGGDLLPQVPVAQLVISIHAPARGRRDCMRSYPDGGYFNPRPREGGDICMKVSTSPTRSFQSTPPARGATQKSSVAYSQRWYFNPRPREGGDRRTSSVRTLRCTFQSTPPARGATFFQLPAKPVCIISIHAPREGGDAGQEIAPGGLHDFNPRPPRGGRLHFRQIIPTSSFHFNPRPPRGGRLNRLIRFTVTQIKFQSTPPARGATGEGTGKVPYTSISIHAPARGATFGHRCRRMMLPFQSTPPARGGDVLAESAGFDLYYFNPRPPRGGRPLCFWDCRSAP